MRLLSALFFAHLMLGAPRTAPPPTKRVVVLFVGNSFLHGHYQPVQSYNAAAITDENVQPGPQRHLYEHGGAAWGGIPGIFKKLTAEAGLQYEVHLEAISGQTLQFHYDSARAVIAQPKWDLVVLQDYSTGPVPTRHGGQPARFATATTHLEQLVHTANPRAQVFLYQTWPRADQTYPATGHYAGLPVDSMTHDLHAAYYRVAAQNGHVAGVLPVGDAWLRVIQAGVALRNPYAPEPGKLNLWGADNYHPSPWGAYLTACVLFGQLTGLDPRTLGGGEQAAAALGLTPTEAKQLQRIARQQLRAAPGTLPSHRSGR